MLLSALSPVFATMFNADWDSKQISIVDTTFEDFETFLAYFYKGDVELTTDNINEIVYMAHKYQDDDILKECTTFMTERLSIVSVLQYYALAIRFNQANLRLNCENFISINMDILICSEFFLQCDKDTLKQMLKLTKMSCMEVDLFIACSKWAINKNKKRGIIGLNANTIRSELNECFELFRFKEMRRKQFAHIFKSMKAFFSNDESDEIFMHFMQTDGLHKNTRYRHVVLKNGKRVFKDDEPIRSTAKKAKLSSPP